MTVSVCSHLELLVEQISGLVATTLLLHACLCLSVTLKLLVEQSSGPVAIILLLHACLCLSGILQLLVEQSSGPVATTLLLHACLCLSLTLLLVVVQSSCPVTTTLSPQICLCLSLSLYLVVEQSSGSVTPPSHTRSVSVCHSAVPGSREELWSSDHHPLTPSLSLSVTLLYLVVEQSSGPVTTTLSPKSVSVCHSAVPGSRAELWSSDHHPLTPSLSLSVTLLYLVVEQSSGPVTTTLSPQVCLCLSLCCTW
jgi:hypothetical protein